MTESHPADRVRAFARISAVSALCNAFLAVFKILCGWLGHSHALIADGVDSLSDLAADLLVWLAGRQAGQAPDADHPYGHERFETAATLILGVFLTLVAVGIGWDAAKRLFAPNELLQPGWLALGAAVASILLKEALFWYTLSYARRLKSPMLRANAWHHRSDAMSSIVVLIGIVGTLAGLTYLDAVASVLVAAMIAKFAFGLGRSAVLELVDTGLAPDRLARIRAAIAELPEVRDLHMLRTRTHAGRASADLHVLVDPRISVSEGHMIAVAVEQRLKSAVDEIAEVTVHIDPEDDETSPVDALLPLRSEALRRLADRCAGVPEFGARRRLILHYLRGGIEVELLFPLSLAAEAERLRAHRRDALAADPVFRQVRLSFGDAARARDDGASADDSL